MRFSQTTLLAAGDMSGSLNSFGIDISQSNLTTIQASWSGSPVGNLKLQISCDPVAVNGIVGQDPAKNVVNWSDYTGSTQAAGGSAGNFGWILGSVGYRWIRVVYTEASGTGSLTVNCDTKGMN